MAAIPASSARKYQDEDVYGPFHRKTKAGADPRRLLLQALKAGELWGRGPSESPLPAVMAFFGKLPPGSSGFEFYSFDRPDQPWGGQVYWHPAPHGHARGEGEWARIKVVVHRASQDVLDGRQQDKSL